MKILLDQDEILAKWGARILEWFNLDEGTSWKESDIVNAWEMEKTLGPTAKHFIRSAMRWPEFYTRLDPVPGAIEGVRKLLDDGHQVRILTSVPKSAGISYHGKCQWLRDNMPWFNLDDFVAIHKKYEHTGDLLFDDGPHNIPPFLATGRMAVIMDRSYNQGVAATARVKSWEEFLRFIDDVKGNFPK